MKKFEDKAIFISGGSSGIGKATAVLLSSWGAHVYIGARNEDQLKQALGEIQSSAKNKQQKSGYVVMDVTNSDQVNSGASKVIAELGGIDLIVTSAGTSHPATFLETDEAACNNLMQINFMGTTNVIRAFLPTMHKQKSGYIACVGSMLGFMGIYGFAAYTASKYAVTGFCDSLRQELLDYNIGISVLFPADTDTPLFHYENKTKPPETAAISGAVTVQSPEYVANVLLKGVAKKKYHIMPGISNKAVYIAYRFVPSVVHFIIDSALKKYRKQNPQSVPV